MNTLIMLNNINRRVIAAHMGALLIRAFDTTKAGWKLTEDGKAIELKDGNPIWINADGTEGTLSSDAITRLNGDAKTLRLAKEAAETKLATFEGIDPVEAKKSLEITKKLNAKQLIDAGEVDRVKTEIAGQYTGQIDELTKKNGTLAEQLNGLKIDNVFSQSQFVRDQIAMPLDMFQAYFRNSLKVAEDGSVEAYDKTGNRIFSKKNLGQVADAAEALEILVDSHPQKAVILKANNNSGGGNGGGGGNRGGTRIVKRADFDAMPAHEKAATAMEAGKGTLTIAD